MPKTVRAVVSVATSDHYHTNMNRLEAALPEESKVFFRGLPPGSPTQLECPYGFKIYAIEEALMMGYTTILWADSSIIPLQSLEPLWRHIESNGYWLASNYGASVGEFCCDSAARAMGLDRQGREELFQIPLVIATAFGMDFKYPGPNRWLARWKQLAKAGAFNGPWRNDNAEASLDSRVRGHRHDQTMASVAADECAMRLIDPPRFIAEQGSPTSLATVLTILR